MISIFQHKYCYHTAWTNALPTLLPYSHTSLGRYPGGATLLGRQGRCLSTRLFWQWGYIITTSMYMSVTPWCRHIYWIGVVYFYTGKQVGCIRLAGFMIVWCAQVCEQESKQQNKTVLLDCLRTLRHNMKTEVQVYAWTTLTKQYYIISIEE